MTKNAAETKLINTSKKRKPKQEVAADLKDIAQYFLRTPHATLAVEFLADGIRASNLAKKSLEDYQDTERIQHLSLLLQDAFLSDMMRAMRMMTTKEQLHLLLDEGIGFTKNSK